MGMVREINVGKGLDGAAPSDAPAGWLEVDARWLASLWGLIATGEVKVILGKIHIGARHPTLLSDGATIL